MNEEDWLKKLLGDVERAKPAGLVARAGLRWWSIWLATMVHLQLLAAWWRRLGKPTIVRLMYTTSNVVPANGEWYPISAGPDVELFEIRDFQWSARFGHGPMMASVIVSISIDNVIVLESPGYLLSGQGRGQRSTLFVPILVKKGQDIAVKVMGGDPKAFHYVAVSGTATVKGPIEHWWSPLRRLARRAIWRLELVRSYGVGL